VTGPAVVAVVGGGLAGLVAAHRVLRAGDVAPGPQAHVTILEAAGRPGGRIRTDRIDGFVVEAGPDSFLRSKPEAVALVDELGLHDEIIGTRPWPRRAFVARAGALHALPEGLSGLVPIRAAPVLASRLLSLPGRLRFLAEPLIPAAPAGGDESMASFARRRFGREAWDWLLEPLLGGIYGGDGDRLGLQSTFPQLGVAEREHGSVLRGLRRAARTAAAVHPARNGAGSPFLSLRGGLERLVDALRRSCEPAGLRLNERAHTLLRTGDRWRIATDRAWLEADVVILAVPAYEAAGLLRAIHPHLASLLGGIPYAPATIVNAAYDRRAVPRPLEGHGYLNPARSGLPVLACTWTSSKFEGRAPEHAVLIRFFLRPGHPDPADALRDEMARVLDVRAAPLWIRVHELPLALPQPGVGHSDRVRAIDGALAAAPGLFLAGNYRLGVGIPDTIRSAEDAAARAIAHLAVHRPSLRSASGSRAT